MITKMIYSIMFVLLLVQTGCTQQQAEINFTFTATGDDGMNGQASFYDIRYAEDTLVLIAWDSASQVDGEPAPQISGSAEDFTLTVPLITSGKKYYFAIRVGDNNGNWSENSNTISVDAPDWFRPSAIMNFNVQFK